LEEWSRADLKRFGAEVDRLRAELDAELGPEDVRHLRKIERWGWFWSALGYATAWICPNPLAVFALSFGVFIRWAVVAHHTLHRGYDRAPGVPQRLTSQGFARGWRRFIDWLDWLVPAAWRHEHNLLHHGRLNEDPADPDLVEALVERHGPRSRPARWLLTALYAVAWKPLYYGPNTLRLHLRAVARREDPSSVPAREPSVLNPLGAYPGHVFLRCWLPYAVWKFAVVPALFLPLGWWAWLSVLVNLLLAEALTNFHSFLMIVPNHAGDDLCRFDESVKGGRGEFYLRQILGSANYRCGGDANDLLHGWLNYQIEHHVWPDLTLLQYQKAQPRLKALCAKYGVPYAQESVFRRFRKMLAVAQGTGPMRRVSTLVPATENHERSEEERRDPPRLTLEMAPA
jgi:fatty acid desaturase